jgi:hypothetical protein
MGWYEQIKEIRLQQNLDPLAPKFWFQVSGVRNNADQ